METIHLKSADPLSQAMLRSAALNGVELIWERAEKLQPQDGFLRLGLSCPYDCLLGPCRIDPFGQGADKGICGLDRDSMVAATLYRLCHRGLLETLNIVPAAARDLENTCPVKVKDLANQVLGSHGLPPLSGSSLLDTVLRTAQGPMNHEKLLLGALHLSLLNLVLAGSSQRGEHPGFGACSAGYGVINGDSACIGFCGTPSPELVRALHRQTVGAQTETAHLVALGAWIPGDGGYLPLACSSGASELLLSSGAVNLVVAGLDADPALFQLCRRLNIPAVTGTAEASAMEILQTACSRHKQSSRPQLFSDVPPARDFTVHSSGKSPSGLVSRKQSGRVGLICGSDMPHMTMGKISQELSAALNNDGMILGGWGDACWWIMNHEQDPSFVAFDPLTGPLLAVLDLAEAGGFDRLDGICYTGLKRCREFATALGLAFLGCRVSIAVPIPILGSREVCRSLSEKLRVSGGELVHFDHPAETEELTAWFANR
jgi:hypothetical protein